MPAKRKSVAPKAKPNKLRFILIYFGIVTAICVLIGGWWGFVAAPILILFAFLGALGNRRKRGAVGALMDEGDRDFERIRKERNARRQARGEGSRPR